MSAGVLLSTLSHNQAHSSNGVQKHTQLDSAVELTVSDATTEDKKSHTLNQPQKKSAKGKSECHLLRSYLVLLVGQSLVHPLTGWVGIFGGALSTELHISLSAIVELKQAEMFGRLASSVTPLLINHGCRGCRFRTLFTLGCLGCALITLSTALFSHTMHSHVYLFWFITQFTLCLISDSIDKFLTPYVSAMLTLRPTMNASRFFALKEISRSLGAVFMIVFGCFLHVSDFSTTIMIFAVTMLAFIPFIYANTIPVLRTTPEYYTTSNDNPKKWIPSISDNAIHLFTDLNIALTLFVDLVESMQTSAVTSVITLSFTSKFPSITQPLALVFIYAAAISALGLGALLPSMKCLTVWLNTPHSLWFRSNEEINRITIIINNTTSSSNSRRTLVSNAMMMEFVMVVFGNVMLVIMYLVWQSTHQSLESDHSLLLLFVLFVAFFAHFGAALARVISTVRRVHFLGVERLTLQSEFASYSSVFLFAGGMLGLQCSAYFLSTIDQKTDSISWQIGLTYAFLTVIQLICNAIQIVRISYFGLLT